MKRFVIVLSVIIFLFSNIICYGENNDYSSLSTDELLDLRALIDQELQNRMKNNSSSIWSGFYVGGQDIAVGSYKLSISSPDGSGAVAIFKSEEDFRRYQEDGEQSSLVFLKEFYNEDVSVYLNITENCVFLLDCSGVESCTLEPSEQSWSR